MSTGAGGSYELQSDGWTLQVTATEFGDTIVWLTGHGQQHQLVYPTRTPFAIYAEGYIPRVTATEENELAVIWERAKHELVFVWITTAGAGAWAHPGSW